MYKLNFILNYCISMAKKKYAIVLLAAFTVVFPAVLNCDTAFYESEDEQSLGDESGALHSLAKSGSINVPSYGYKKGEMGLMPGAEKMLMDEYNSWKRDYVTADGCAVGKRVKRDVGNGVTPYDTVSEGQAYGMLLAVYFDDQDLFDDLYEYAQYHKDSSMGNFMHWYINSAGTRISEFNFAVPHYQSYIKTVYGVYGTSISGVTSATDTLPNYFTNSSGNRTPDAGVPGMGGYGWLPASVYERGLSNATDADFDMAVALIFATKRWSSNYGTVAESFIKNICKYNVDLYTDGNNVKKFFLKPGAKWGGRKGWNPSYYMPAYLKLFQSFMGGFNAGSFAGPAITPYQCDTSATYAQIVQGLLDTMNAEMAKIDAANGSAGLFPDWCDTYNKTAPQKPAGNSDRRYYQVAWNGYVYEVQDIRGARGSQTPDGKVDENDGLDLQSTNFYYDAVRVPWRLAMDYSWYGTDGSAISKKTTDEIATFFTGKLNTFVDGYSIDGTPWKFDNRDGFNGASVPAEPRAAGSGPSVSFLAMIPTAMLNKNFNEAETWFADLKARRISTTENYHYYGNTLRLMSLLYLSGYMVNLWDGTTWYNPTVAPVNDTKIRIRSCQSDKASHFININSLASGNLVQTSDIEFSWQRAKWRVKTSVENGTTYYNFYSLEADSSGNRRWLYVDDSNDGKVRFMLTKNATADTGLDFILTYSSTVGGWSIKSRKNNKYLTISTLTQAGVTGNILKYETHAQGPSAKHYWCLDLNN